MSNRNAGRPFGSYSDRERLLTFPFYTPLTRSRVVRRPVDDASSWSPPVDIHESETGYEIEIEVPGAPADTISVECHEQVLTISGQKADPRASGDDADKPRCTTRERRFGSFRRSFRLPTDVDEDAIRAKCVNGVLSVAVPKQEPSRPTTIAINS